jgi:hypothetical protein
MLTPAADATGRNPIILKIVATLCHFSLTLPGNAALATAVKGGDVH